SNFVAAYGIELAPEPEDFVRRKPQWAFMVTGYSECVDSFFALGLVESAKPLSRRPFFELKVLAVWLFLIWERIGIARSVESGAQQGRNFTVNGAKSVGNDIDVAGLIDLCLAENERRMSLYDDRLLRPFAVPALARLARRFIRPTPARS